MSFCIICYQPLVVAFFIRDESLMSRTTCAHWPKTTAEQLTACCKRFCPTILPPEPLHQSHSSCSPFVISPHTTLPKWVYGQPTYIVVISCVTPHHTMVPYNCLPKLLTLPRLGLCRLTNRSNASIRADLSPHPRPPPNPPYRSMYLLPPRHLSQPWWGEVMIHD